MKCVVSQIQSFLDHSDYQPTTWHKTTQNTEFSRRFYRFLKSKAFRCILSSIDFLPSENPLNHRKTWALDKILLKVCKSFRYSVPKPEAKSDRCPKLMSLNFRTHQKTVSRKIAYGQTNDSSEFKLVFLTCTPAWHLKCCQLDHYVTSIFT